MGQTVQKKIVAIELYNELRSTNAYVILSIASPLCVAVIYSFNQYIGGFIGVAYAVYGGFVLKRVRDKMQRLDEVYEICQRKRKQAPII